MEISSRSKKKGCFAKFTSLFKRNNNNNNCDSKSMNNNEKYVNHNTNKNHNNNNNNENDVAVKKDMIKRSSTCIKYCEEEEKQKQDNLVDVIKLVENSTSDKIMSPINDNNKKNDISRSNYCKNTREDDNAVDDLPPYFLPHLSPLENKCIFKIDMTDEENGEDEEQEAATKDDEAKDVVLRNAKCLDYLYEDIISFDESASTMNHGEDEDDEEEVVDEEAEDEDEDDDEEVMIQNEYYYPLFRNNPQIRPNIDLLIKNLDEDALRLNQLIVKKGKLGN